MRSLFCRLPRAIWVESKYLVAGEGMLLAKAVYKAPLVLNNPYTNSAVEVLGTVQPALNPKLQAPNPNQQRSTYSTTIWVSLDCTMAYPE